jgi:hypothetical protein
MIQQEAELAGLTGEEREKRKKQLIEKRRGEIEALDQKHEELNQK